MHAENQSKLYRREIYTMNANEVAPKSPKHVWPNRCCSRAGNSPAAVHRKRCTAAKSKSRSNNRESVGPLGARAPDRRCNPNPTSVQQELIRNCHKRIEQDLMDQPSFLSPSSIL